MYKQTLDLKDAPKVSGEPKGVFFEKKTITPRTIPTINNTNKTPRQTTASPATVATVGKESKYRKIAKFLILIGSQQAAEILAELDPDQVDEISKEIALTEIIRPEERDEIFAEFHEIFSRPYQYTGSSRGGMEAARRILYAAKGPEKGEEILNKAIPASKENLFGFLEDFSAEQLVMLLKSENAQTTAVILSRMSPKVSAETISKLPPEKKPDILKRMAYQKEISPEVLEQISAALKEKVRHIAGSSNDIQIDGMQALAAILKQGDFAFGDKIIEELEKEDPTIGKDLKEKLYTLDDVIYTIDRPIQDKLKLMSDIEIAILLKGRGKDFSDKILSCVSASRRKLIREEYEIMGAVPKKDCDAAAGEFLAWFRDAREKGDIILLSDEDVFL